MSMNKVKSQRRAIISRQTKRFMVSSCSPSGRNKSRKGCRVEIWKNVVSLMTRLTHIYNLGRIFLVGKIASFVATRMAFSVGESQEQQFLRPGPGIHASLITTATRFWPSFFFFFFFSKVAEPLHTVSSLIIPLSLVYTIPSHLNNHVPYRTHTNIFFTYTWKCLSPTSDRTADV